MRIIEEAAPGFLSFLFTKSRDRSVPIRKVSISGKYREFCEVKFGLRRSLEKIRDSRERPQIPLATVLRSVHGMWREVEHRITAAVGQWDGLPYRLKVAMVEEEKLKPRGGKGKFEVFGVVTTDERLSGEEMRGLAHLMWVIENNVFIG